MARHRMTTMNLGACVGYAPTVINHRLSFTTSIYNGKIFYDHRNYRLIIKCLDDGYHVANDLLEYMQDYSDILQSIIDRLNSYSKKWKSKLKHQSSLSSYHTTKRAQSQVIRSPIKLAQLVQSRYDAIQQVIISYQKQVEQMYPTKRFSNVRKHYRSHEMERLFRNAYSYIERVLNKLDKLHQQEKIAEESLHQTKSHYENLVLDETTSVNKLAKALHQQENKERDLMYIKERIARVEQELNEEKRIYRQKATEIYHQCRALEEERLNQIRETLIRFVEATHSSEYSTEKDAMYNDLLSSIVSEQDTQCDLDFWGKTYGVDIQRTSTTTTVEVNETDNDHETSEIETTLESINIFHQNETINENEEVQSMTDKSSNSEKNGSKKKNQK